VTKIMDTDLKTNQTKHFLHRRVFSAFCQG